ncbi:MAG TPA: nickel/cobalt transporter, partial [Bradyrhizobium sp.]
FLTLPGTKPAATILICSALIAAVVMCASPASAQTSPFGAAPAASGFAGWLLSKQAVFYRALSGTILIAKIDGSALWTLMGIAFVYGVFHAAGPGHGKAVISSYLLANDETWRRGVTLSFASALVQSLTAILIVGVAAVLLGGTAKMMGQAVRVIEIASYGLIVVLGARLLWVKGLGFIRAAAALRRMPHDDARVRRTAVEPGCAHPYHHARDAHAGAHDQRTECGAGHHGLFQRQRHHAPIHCDACDHDHAHDHGHEPDVLPWGHAHGPEPQELGGPGGWKRGLSAIVAVGLRPCSGAIILLVFALSQGLFWAGVAAAFVMGLGTAITVAAIATLAVSARTFARRFTTNEAGYGGVVVRGLEAGAASLILAFGILLLAGYMASERLVGF